MHFPTPAAFVSFEADTPWHLELDVVTKGLFVIVNLNLFHCKSILSGDGSKYADFCVSCSDCCHPLATEAFSSGMFKELNRNTRSMGSTQLRDIARSCLSTRKLLSLNLLNKLDSAMARRGNTLARVRLVIASLLVLIGANFHGSQLLTFSLAKRIQEVARDEGISSIEYLEKVGNNAEAYRKSSEVVGRLDFMYGMQEAWACCACSFLKPEIFAVFSCANGL